MSRSTTRITKPGAVGLYRPDFERDSCGVGLVCNIDGSGDNNIVRNGLLILKRLSHRGAVGADPDTGDGAGILMQIPDEFFRHAAAGAKIDLPAEGEYGTGLVFLPPDREERKLCKGVFSGVVNECGYVLSGWREVPVDGSCPGLVARESMPVIEQIFIVNKFRDKDRLNFERALYLIRKKTERAISAIKLKQGNFFYITNLSCRTFSYKGLLTPEQVEKFFLDLGDRRMKTSLALVHSRYSTNTFPSWDLAQPFRFLAHNGEINTLAGNVNWMRARESTLSSNVFGRDFEYFSPIVVPGGSDSAALDNVVELLSLSGKDMIETMMMLIPAGWENDNFSLEDRIRDFYLFNACTMEPWDGPASIVFTDGGKVGAIMDRNGLRPSRYIITKQGMAIMASEVGVLDVSPGDISCSGRLGPGEMICFDIERGLVYKDLQLKRMAAEKAPYSQWLKDNMVCLDSVPKEDIPYVKEDLCGLWKAFGYTREDLGVILAPMAGEGQEPTGSMGMDIPLAVLSRSSQVFYNYFKQLFAQVTNPAIDPIRERCVMSLDVFLGPRKNLLEPGPDHCHCIRVKNPVLTERELGTIKSGKINGFKSREISILFDTAEPADLERVLDRICREAAGAVSQGVSFIILSDRGISKNRAAIPALLATSAVHHYLVSQSARTRISIIVECADARETHHLALLFGYGADCVSPYLAYKTVSYLSEKGYITRDRESAIENYRAAICKGILKILSKMGISTLRSYCGAHIFEALGLHSELIDRYFPGTISRIEGADLNVIYREIVDLHKQAYVPGEILPSGGVYQWKRDGQTHLWRPDTISALQEAVRNNNYFKYKEFARLINDQSEQPVTLRGLLKFRKTRPVPIEQVEPLEKILKRFAVGAMSFGSISRPAHETLALAMNRMGARSNTGEGGEDPARFKPLAGGESKRSAIKQIASGRFGVNTNYLVNADEIQIKIAQGAKPGEGGQLPGHKVSAEIARIRYTTAGVTLISPPPHHDIYSIEDLAQLIFDLKNVNPSARVSVKLVSEPGVGTVAAGVAKGGADMILISGGDGGTGASPKSSIRHAGLPWELGVSETQQTLTLNGLRSRVKLQTDGQMRTGRDVAIAALLGAEEFGFATSALIVLGCLMLRHCQLNNCACGIATQNKVLQKRFSGKPEHLENYFRFVASELREIMSQLGVRTVDELVGRTDLLELNRDVIPWKAGRIDLSRILYQPGNPYEKKDFHFRKTGTNNKEEVLDRELILKSSAALDKKDPVKISSLINNTSRAVGAMLSGRVCSLYGEEGLPEDTISVEFSGIAGQSFGAWLAGGVTFKLKGLANDYVGKGISGGKIIICPYAGSVYPAEENTIIGNTCFYGAISGHAYINGRAGERFCVRNSGLWAVVEGVGDHGCEYMTGGRVVILGEVGINFAAGMSGGIAYLFDPDGNAAGKCNLGMVARELVGDKDKEVIYGLLCNHLKYTQSKKAGDILSCFDRAAGNFIKIIPLEYKRILEEKEERYGTAAGKGL